MIANRKGLSDVVTTVLIILLVLAAVVIVGNYVIKFTRDSGEKVTGGVVCQGLDIEVTKCTKGAAGATGVAGIVTFKINAGDASKVSKVRVLGYLADGTSKSGEATGPFELYNTKQVTLSSVGELKDGSAGVVEVTVDEIATACQFKESRKVTCT